MKSELTFLFLLCIISLCFACTSEKQTTDREPLPEIAVESAQTTKPAATSSTDTGKLVVPERVPDKNPIRVIETFYKAYIKAFGLGWRESELLKEKYLTKGLIEKTRRIGAMTGADPITRTQDVNEYMLETVRAKHLGGDWYMVEYDWYPDKDDGHDEIPLKLTHANGLYMIDYITPSWNESRYGDSLLLNNLPKQAIDTTSALSFLESFYSAYVSEYCSMPEGLERRLATFRKAHLTAKALAQFRAAEEEQKLDGGNMNWDLLIAAFDFDCVWIPSMTYRQLNGDTYEMRYVKAPSFERLIHLEVLKTGKGYKIDKVHIEKGPW